MNARIKLNLGHIYGSVVFAALVGWLTGSMFIFFLTTLLLVGGSLYSGDIRFHGGAGPQAGSRNRR